MKKLADFVFFVSVVADRHDRKDLVKTVLFYPTNVILAVVSLGGDRSLVEFNKNTGSKPALVQILDNTCIHF